MGTVWFGFCTKGNPQSSHQQSSDSQAVCHIPLSTEPISKGELSQDLRLPASLCARVQRSIEHLWITELVRGQSLQASGQVWKAALHLGSELIVTSNLAKEHLP
jgi:hypothetical protein